MNRNSSNNSTGSRDHAAPAAVRTHLITARETSTRPAPRYRPNQVRKIRASVRLSQAVFAATLNVSPETLRAWEQGKKRPGGAAARLLELAEKHPRWVLGAVHLREPKQQQAGNRTASLHRSSLILRGSSWFFVVLCSSHPLTASPASSQMPATAKISEAVRQPAPTRPYRRPHALIQVVAKCKDDQGHD